MQLGCATFSPEIIQLYFINWLFLFLRHLGMVSKSTASSPTGSVHNTPTHQAKPQTLDPFADLGALGANLAG